MDVKNVVVEREVEDELIWLTASKYALFYSYGKAGIDAKTLYEHYQFTAILQKTNSVWALEKYCRQGLKWGKDRYLKAKNLLLDLDLIEQGKRRDEQGRITMHYVKVRTKRVQLEPTDLSKSSIGLETHPVDEPTGGFQNTNALTKNTNALTKKGNIGENPFVKKVIEFWNSKSNLISHKENAIKRNLKKKHLDIILEYGDFEVRCAIENYSFVLSSNDHFFSYRWSLWDFIARGLDRFVKEAEPRKNFKNSVKDFVPLDASTIKARKANYETS